MLNLDRHSFNSIQRCRRRRVGELQENVFQWGLIHRYVCDEVLVLLLQCLNFCKHFGPIDRLLLDDECQTTLKSKLKFKRKFGHCGIYSPDNLPHILPEVCSDWKSLSSNFSHERYSRFHRSSLVHCTRYEWQSPIQMNFLDSEWGRCIWVGRRPWWPIDCIRIRIRPCYAMWARCFCWFSGSLGCTST